MRSSPASVRPVQAPAAAEATLRPEDELVFRKRRRLVRGYAKTGEGATQLRMFYGTKELRFDDADLFPFGEKLGTEERFIAESATRWRDGAPYAWETIAPLLEHLLEAKILSFAADVAAEPCNVSPAPSVAARSWSADETHAIMLDLTGRAVEHAHLESFLPSYRIAHDATALEAMSEQRGPILATLVEIRAEYVKRFPMVLHRWTVGDLHTFSAVVLSVVGHALMRGDLSPILSSLYRLTDGVRMATHNMLVPSVEPLTHDTILSRDELNGYIERNHSFLSDNGVGADPPSLIEGFFRALFDGECPEAFESNLLSDLPAAVDYGLLGLRLYATTFSLWIEMGLAYEQLSNVLRPRSDDSNPRFERLRARVDEEISLMMAASLWNEADRSMHDRSYGHMREHSARGLRPTTTIDRGIDSTVRDPDTLRAIETALARVEWLPADRRPKLAKVLASFINDAQNTLRRAKVLTQSINEVLGRPQATRALEDRDLACNPLLRQDQVGQLPYLLDTIADELGIRLSTTPSELSIEPAAIRG